MKCHTLQPSINIQKKTYPPMVSGLIIVGDFIPISGMDVKYPMRNIYS